MLVPLQLNSFHADLEHLVTDFERSAFRSFEPWPHPFLASTVGNSTFEQRHHRVRRRASSLLVCDYCQWWRHILPTYT